MKVFGDCIMGCVHLLKQHKGLHRKHLKQQFHFTDNTLDKRLKDIQKLSVEEFIHLVAMYLKNTHPGVERVKALLDILALFLYRSEEMQELFPDGDALFEEHPRKLLEDYVIEKKYNVK